MANYNIIYHSRDGADYLWNGSSFDELSKKENNGLFYSGKSLDDDNVAGALANGLKVIHSQFPDDTDPRLEKAEVPVSNDNNEGGHHHKMTS